MFWFGDEDVGMDEVPQTGSGKVKKHVLRQVGVEIVEGEKRGMEERGVAEEDVSEYRLRDIESTDVNKWVVDVNAR